MTTQNTIKKYYTVEEANATLPLLRSILRDVTDLANELRDRHQRLVAIQNAGKLDADRQEELDRIADELENGQERMQEFADELQKLQIELKDIFTGLVDFPCWMDGREVFLCWRLGEASVAHWHELDAGFAGRRKLGKKSMNH